eukprot:sb/3464492/
MSFSLVWFGLDHSSGNVNSHTAKSRRMARQHSAGSSFRNHHQIVFCLSSVAPSVGCRSLNDIMTELNTSLHSLDSAGHSEDTNSLFENSSYTTAGSMTESMAELATDELVTALRTQRAQVMERRAELSMKLAVLENEEMAILTGQRVHQVAAPIDWNRKHVNTGFTINDPSQGINTMDEVSRLEFDVELQKKIVNAARRLSREHGIGKTTKRDRKMATQRSLLKLQELETKLQCARRFQKPALATGGSTAGNQDKLKEHQSYYKAMTDNGYYPHPARKHGRNFSSTSEDKGSSCESDGSSIPSTPLVSSSCLSSSSGSVNAHGGPTLQDSVRQCLHMSLSGDTKTLPRNKNGKLPPKGPASLVSPESVFAPWSVKIDSLGSKPGESGAKKYEQYRPRAGSFRPESDPNDSHSYDKYLHTLRLNRQRNSDNKPNIEFYESKATSCGGPISITTVPHSTVV